MTQENMGFRTSFAKNIFVNKYAKPWAQTWEELADCIVDDVCGVNQYWKRPILTRDEIGQLKQYVRGKKFIPGGRYLYYAGRPLHSFQNCYLLRGLEDTREEWGGILQRSSDCLMSGGGIGVDYSRFREGGKPLSRTGGESSGPLPLMQSVNDHGRGVKQGGSRRSAIYASLNWRHGDVNKFLVMKNWHDMALGKAHRGNLPYTVADAKVDDFHYPAPMDCTNISLNYDDAFLQQLNSGLPETYVTNVRQALQTGEPGLSFNFGSKENETLRNACCEVVSEDDSDVCNLGSINFANIANVEELRDVVYLGSMFLVCGTIRGDLPYQKVYEVREKNRRLGLGLMGLHEWILQRNYKYEVNKELHDWLEAYEIESVRGARGLCYQLGISQPIAYRAIAPTGTIGIMAATTTGIEPLFAVAYKRRYLQGGTWKYENVVDATADFMIQKYDLKPENIETATDLANDVERRIKFQYDVQRYVDQSISSTINLPEWGSELNNEDKVIPFAHMLAKYATGLRGFTCYPNAARGGQPLTSIPYEDAVKSKGVVFDEVDVCTMANKSSCG